MTPETSSQERIREAASGKRRAGGSRAATIAWAACFAGAFVATHLPPGAAPSPALIGDKALHFIGFLVLGGVTVWRWSPRRLGLRERRRIRANRLARAIVIYGLLLAYAAFDEATQPWVGRSFEWGDLAADAAGALVGFCATTLLVGRCSLDSGQRRSKLESNEGTFE